MPCNCGAPGCNEMFGDATAHHEARQFRRHGLPRRARKLLAALERTIPLNGIRTLEVGAGVGGFTITLLRHGASHATIVDASAAYVATARQLAAESGFAPSLDIELANYAEPNGGGRAEVDVVVMDRVVCCYPVWQDLLAQAARQTRKVIALSYPRDTWWSRLGVAAANQLLRLRRTEFRVFVHSVAAMHATLRQLGFDPRVHAHWGPWEIAIATRTH
jgi:magnesium-protoporphyrin O-methyltransferase